MVRAKFIEKGAPICSLISKAPSVACHSGRAHHHRSYHGLKWNDWRPLACSISGSESLFFWFLVELLQRHQSRDSVYFLVRNPVSVSLSATVMSF